MALNDVRIALTEARRLLQNVESNVGDVPVVVIFDVGANNGRWSDAVMRYLSKPSNIGRQTALRRTRLMMFEPQPRYRAALKSIADNWNGTHMPVAAWFEQTNLTFHVGGNSEAASLVKANTMAHAARLGVATIRNVTVPAIDFAAFLRYNAAPPSPGGLTIVKIDVEAAEYNLLPHLLLTGALCHADHLLIEWHLNALPAKERLSGLGLRLALQHVLKRCPSAPKVVEQVPSMGNEYEPVPGLNEEASRHNYSVLLSLLEQQKIAPRGQRAPFAPWNQVHAEE